MAFKIPDTPEELFRQGRRGISEFNRWLPYLILIVVVLGIILSSFYSVGTDEVGVIRFFGKYARTEQPGLHWKWPFNIEQLDKVKVRRIFKEEFGFRTIKPGINTQYSPQTNFEESLMLTGDLNVAVVEWIVQYTVKDPVQFAFRVRDPRTTIRNMSEAVMRLVVGDHTINQVLTEGREDIQREAEDKLQEVLDSYGAGIVIHNVILQDVTPPNEVKPSFNEVNEARQEKEKLINQAWEEYNRVIPMAKGQAEQIIREAEGYALERVNQAEGDAGRFTLAWEAYKSAPEVTRRRLYLETMQKVMPQLKDTLIIDDSQKGLLPLLHLNEEPRAEGKQS